MMNNIDRCVTSWSWWFIYILDTHTRPSAALEAPQLTRRCASCLAGVAATPPAIAYAMGWGLWPEVEADAAKPAHTHVSWLTFCITRLSSQDAARLASQVWRLRRQPSLTRWVGAYDPKSRQKPRNPHTLMQLTFRWRIRTRIGRNRMPVLNPCLYKFNIYVDYMMNNIDRCVTSLSWWFFALALVFSHLIGFWLIP